MAALSAQELQQFSLLDCAHMLAALPQVDAFATVRAALAKHLCARPDSAWVDRGDAYEVYTVLAALWQYDPASVTGEWLATAIRRLVRSEVAEGGPYRVTLAANVQIAQFASQVAKPLPNMNAYAADIARARRFASPELTRFGLLYLLTSIGYGQELVQYVHDNWLRSNWQTPWRKAVALKILEEEPRTPAIEQALLFVCAKQRNGLWEGEPFMKKGNQKCADFVVTALIVGVLYDYAAASEETVSKDLPRMRKIVSQAATRMFKMHPEPLRSSALAMVDRVCKADQNFEITLMPQFFERALDVPGDVHSTTLGLANLYVWIAYSIYDDFIDNEGNPAGLPVANVAMRASLNCFRTVLPHDAQFQRYVDAVFAGMDGANAWEINNCRFVVQDGSVVITELPKYGNCTVLAKRAFAHALTPMAILAQHARENAKQLHHIESAFRHYLIARQLNDDMHDWLKDMQAGQASYVVTTILRDMHVKQGRYDLDKLLPAMQGCFRRTTMLKVCERMLWHITAARQHFAKSQLLRVTNDVYLLLDTLELSARKSMDTYAKSKAFTNSPACLRFDR